MDRRDRSGPEGCVSSILTLECFVAFLKKTNEPTTTFAVISCCSSNCRDAYLDLLQNRKEEHMPSRWVAFILWQANIQPRSGVSVASLVRLEKALTMSVEQLIFDYTSQDSFLMFASDPKRIVFSRDHLRLPSQDMMPILNIFDEARQMVDPDETDVVVLTTQLKIALLHVPPFLLRLLVARDCHLERILDDRYSDAFYSQTASEEALEAISGC